ncbi:uncharacterized protein LOC132057309 [Lycium ferocissimum]|uniref:uncharacterized protein LOC132057309 n=1 Tax=Lycium ferocissimum TaxID=112874 RepID=UPI0028165C03|nr:uncharacterized protein LOC132057309 [Lycium ferocissimum]
MDHRQPPQINHQTTTSILKQSTTTFLSNTLLFFFLSTLILTFHSNLQNGTHYITSLIDHNPSLKSLLSHINLNSNSPDPKSLNSGRNQQNRRPFLHLSRVGTLDDDFFSSDSDFEKSLFYPSIKQNPNFTYLVLDPNLGFSGQENKIIDNGVFWNKVVRNGFISFKEKTTNNNNSENENENEKGVVDLQFLIKGIENNDATSLLFLVSLLSGAYAYVVLAFLVTYTWVHGIVFLQVLDNVLGNYRSVFRTAWEGSNLGLRRLSGFVLMRWAVRDALAQLLGIWVFGEIEDQYAFFKVFVRMKLMPFSDVAPWVKGYEKESFCFVVSWFLVELVVGFIFAVDSWVSIVDSRKSGREVVKEGCHLLGIMVYPAIGIKCWEVLICGWCTRWLLGRLFGEVFALAFQSVMEVYFMVAWLTFYLAARYNDASSVGRTFGRRELEGFLEGVR